MVYQILIWLCLVLTGLGLGIIALLWDWHSLRTYRLTFKLPPFSTIPILGDMWNLGSRTPGGFLKEVQRRLKAKEIVRISRFIVLGIPCIGLFHPDDIEVLLGSTINIKKGFEYIPLKPWLREGLLLSFGKKWRQRRKLLTPTFHFRILEDNVSQISRHSRTFVKKLLATGGRTTDLDELVHSLTLDVICETAMGISINSQEGGAEDYVNAIKRATELGVKRLVQFWLLNDRIFNLSSTGRKFKKDLNTIHTFSENVIKSRREERMKQRLLTELKPASEKRKAFLDILLETEENNPGLLTSEDIREEVDTFMFEGHDTTSAALTFALYELGRHPDVQERLWEEQIEIFGSEEREPTLQDINNMNYLEMCLKEVLRMYPSVPWISRKLNKDLILGDGTVVPSEANTIIIPFLLHRNKEFWDEPEVFRPERFLPGVGRHPFSYIPFSAGPRNCIGSKFAMLELKTTLSYVVRHCLLETVTQGLDLTPNLILRNIGPIELKVFPRQGDKKIVTNGFHS